MAAGGEVGGGEEEDESREPEASKRGAAEADSVVEEAEEGRGAREKTGAGTSVVMMTALSPCGGEVAASEKGESGLSC